VVSPEKYPFCDPVVIRFPMVIFAAVLRSAGVSEAVLPEAAPMSDNPCEPLVTPWVGGVGVGGVDAEAAVGVGVGGIERVAESEMAPLPVGDWVKEMKKLAGAGVGVRDGLKVPAV
jgi:hypothetical protein